MPIDFDPCTIFEAWFYLNIVIYVPIINTTYGENSTNIVRCPIKLY